MPAAYPDSVVDSLELAPPAWNVAHLSTFTDMAALLESTVANLKELGYAATDVFAARLVLEEAICNAIKHGHQNDARKVVEVRWLAGRENFLVEVEDQGPGFDPDPIPDATHGKNLGRTCGRGLLLIRHYAAWVQHNRQGNCVAFCICSSASRDASPTGTESRT